MNNSFKFSIRDSAGNPTTTIVGMDDMFVPKDAFLNSGLWAWGYNNAGQLGLNDITNRLWPIQVGTLNDWTEIACGKNNFTAAIKKDKTLWTWGSNGFTGPLGLNNLTLYSSPVQVGSLTNWSKISCGRNHTSAIKTDGTIWAWGENYHGALGLNTQTNYSSPVQVGSLTNWNLISCGDYCTAAIKTDGTLWTWGRNEKGQLGLNDITTRSSPVQVGSLTDWKQIACGVNHTAAIKTNGTLWMWGSNNPYGQLGLGNLTDVSSPVQVGALTNWKQVSSGGTATAAIKTDGTLWTWGTNTSGQLGLNDLTSRSSPVQVGSLTNWKYVTCGVSSSAAIKTDLTLWMWGADNGLGTLGRGSITGTSSPVQVGPFNGWKKVSVTSSTLAITDGFL